MKKFDVIFLKDAKEFLDELDAESRKKVLYNIWKSREINDPKLFKKISNDIWEFRTRYLSKQIRLLAFWDKEDSENVLVIACRGFIKNSKKTPRREIDSALLLMKKYFKFKKGR